MKSNIKAINEYMDYKENILGLSDVTIYGQKNLLLRFDKYVNKSFKSLKEKDIIEFIKPLKQRPKQTTVTILKTFFRWYYKLDKDDKLPDCIRMINIKKPNYDEIEYRKRVITENEYLLLLKYSLPKYKAIFELLYNVGLRKGELCSIKYDGIKYENGITKITINKSKTRSRDTILKGRLKYLLEWSELFNLYKDDKETYLFYGDNPYKKLNPSAINGMLTRLCKKIKSIDRNITVHDFRHTYITDIRKTVTPISFVEENTGLVKGSGMMKVYDHNKIKDYEEWLKKKDDEIEISYSDLKGKQQKEIANLRKEMKDYQDILAETMLINLEYMKEDIKKGNTNFWSKHKDKLEEGIKILNDK